MSWVCLGKVALFGYFTSGLLRESYDSKIFPHPLAIHMYCFTLFKKNNNNNNKPKKNKRKTKERKKKEKKEKKNKCDYSVWQVVLCLRLFNSSLEYSLWGLMSMKCVVVIQLGKYVLLLSL